MRVMGVRRHGSNALRVVYASFSPHLSKLEVDSWRMYAQCLTWSSYGTLDILIQYDTIAN